MAAFAPRLPHLVAILACLLLAVFALLALARPGAVALSGRTASGGRVTLAVHGTSVSLLEIEREPVSCASGYRTTVSLRGAGATVRYPDGELASVTSAALSASTAGAREARGEVRLTLRLYQPGQAPDVCTASDRFLVGA